MIDSTTPIEFGVLLTPDHQWLDAAGPVDYINQHSQVLFKPAYFPEALVKKAAIINWHYISYAGDLKPIQATSGPVQPPSTTFKDCPALDYLIVPGPDPFLELSPECIAFLKTQYAGLKALLTVCTGSMLLAQTGLLDGVHAATNKWGLKFVTEKGAFERFNKVKWVTNKRFVVDGKVWSAAGVTAGLDLGAEFSRVHFDPEIVKLAMEASEYVPRGAEPDPYAYLLEGIELK
ncbi:hypothetical protein D9611_010416 [Ephemerocybe angulata]|uniref:DJ-1/PfpI domain-containing protein n=1 Tax=Ephemerocybe angulata TaxID=980116 RepID=A0A8H5BVK8_9AGAR|nr:hypothetical protein D9611_010416 [Tulosesus angulatus]